MSRLAKYFVLGEPENGFYDFDLRIGPVDISGGSIFYAGSRAIDSIFTRPGLSFDLTVTGASPDKIYFPGSYSSYNFTRSGSVISASRGSGDTAEAVSFLSANTAVASDSLIFADGSVSSYDLYDHLRNGAAEPTPSGETSAAPEGAASESTSRSAVVKAFALGTEGEVFASPSAGVQLIAAGSLGVDTVYVRSGGNVDATLLGAAQDKVYFQGAWAEYSKVVSGNTITFTRTVEGQDETVKVVGGLRGGQDDQLTFIDGSVGSYQALLALKENSDLEISVVSDFDASVTTPLESLSLLSDGFKSINNLDVRSDIVLTFSEDVAAQAGKFIKIIDASASGFRGENLDSSIQIDAANADLVSISGNVVTINPAGDLDLSSDYRLEIDEGAFLGAASGTALAQITGATALEFSTVTPGGFAIQLAQASQIMETDGSLGIGAYWLDIEDIGSPSGRTSVPLDLSSQDYVLVAKDYSSDGPDYDIGFDGILTGDFFVGANQFSAGDVVYIDNQSAQANDLSELQLIDKGVAPVELRFAGNTGLGGYIDVTLADPLAAVTFESIEGWKSYLGVDYDPITSDADERVGDDTEVSDVTPPTIAISAAVGSVEIGETITINFTLSEASETFSSQDVFVQGGAISDFQGTGKAYTAIFSPSPGSVTATVQVASGAFSDLAGNLNQDGLSLDNTLTLQVTQAPPQSGVVDIEDNGTYIATEEQDVFRIDTTQPISADISGFATGDILMLENLTQLDDLVFADFNNGDGDTVLTAGSASITLSDLSSDAFDGSLAGFQSLFGAQAIQGVASTTVVATDGNYTASGLSDTYVIDASKPIYASIDGFQSGDQLRIINLGDNAEVYFTDSAYGNGETTMTAGLAVIELTGLVTDSFAPLAEGFEAVFGSGSIDAGSVLTQISDNGVYAATARQDVFLIDSPDGVDLSVTIDGFAPGDILAFADVTEQQGVNFAESVLDPEDGVVQVTAGTDVITLTGIGPGFFNNEDAFLQVFGDQALQYAPPLA